MSDETTNESNDEGKETPTDIPKPEDNSGSANDGLSPLDRAEAANKEKATLLDREEKLQDRKEKFLAEEKVGGRAIAGKVAGPVKLSNSEYAAKFMKGEVDPMTDDGISIN